MALDFPTNPTDGQVYGNFYYSASKGAWRSTTNFNTPNSLKNATITTTTANGVPLTVQGFNSQSANLQEWKNSSGTTLASIGSTGILSAPNAAFTGSISATQVIGTTPNDSGSTGGVAIKTPAGGSQTSGYLQFVNNAYTTQYGAISADVNSNMTVSASQLNLPTKTYAPGHIVQVQHAQTSWWQGITAHDITAIGDLSISFTPRFSNSKILLQAMINSSGTYVASFGFLKNGGYLSGVTNTNSQGSVSTTYWTDTSTNYMTNTYISYVDTPGTTSAITYQAAACSGWSGSAYYMTINDRGDGTMRSVSTLTIMEIAQ